MHHLPFDDISRKELWLMMLILRYATCRKAPLFSPFGYAPVFFLRPSLGEMCLVTEDEMLTQRMLQTHGDDLAWKAGGSLFTSARDNSLSSLVSLHFDNPMRSSHNAATRCFTMDLVQYARGYLLTWRKANKNILRRQLPCALTP